MGPTGEVRTCGKVWSLATLSLKTTVVASGASMDSTLPSKADGPFGSAIFSCRSKVNFTSLESRSCPLAHFSPLLSLTVYSVGVVNSADSAKLIDGSGLPGSEFSRNGKIWFMTMNEPLSYDPAGSREVTLSVVPRVIGALESPEPPELLSSAAEVQPVRARAEIPTTAAASRSPFFVRVMNHPFSRYTHVW